MEYKIGDWVVRINNGHLGIEVGQICQIYEISDFKNQPKLKGQNDPTGSHSTSNLRKALPEEITEIMDYSYLIPILTKIL